MNCLAVRRASRRWKPALGKAARTDGPNERRRQAEANYSHGKINKIGLPKKFDAWQERAFVWEKFVMLGDDGANLCFKRAEAML